MNIKESDLDEVKFQKIDSLSELKEIFKDGSIVFGEKQEGLNSFYSLTLKDINVGLCSSNQGKNSGVLKFNEFYLIFNDQQIHQLSPSGSIIWESRLDGIIYDVEPYQNDKVIVISEIGVYSFSQDGNKNWGIPCDLITDFKINGTQLIIFEEDEEKVFNLEDGSSL